MRAIVRDLYVSDNTIRSMVQENIRYNTYMIRKGQFMPAHTQEQRLLGAKRLLKNVETRKEPGTFCFFIFLDEKIPTKMNR